MATPVGAPARPRSWAPPGFRHTSVWRRAVAVAGYVGIALLALVTVGKPFAALCFLVAALSFVALVLNFRGAKERLGARFGGKHPKGTPILAAGLLLLAGGCGWVAGLPASTRGAGAPQPLAATPAAVMPTSATPPAPPAVAGRVPLPSAVPTPASSDQAKAEAVDLLGAAVHKREEGQFGLALELGRQALGKWPEYGDARSFVATVQPQATAAQGTAVAQATAQTREAIAQETAQARAAATAQAQAATAARQQATAQALAAATAATAANLQIVSVTSPAPRNSNATVTIRTVPGATCAITVQYASGPSGAAGLGPKTAGPAGAVSWTWQVGGNTTLGEWPISVACSSGGQRWERQTSFRVG